MQSNRLRFAGAMFMIAGGAFVIAGLLDDRGVFFVLGCAFIALGGAFLAVSRRAA